MERVKAKLGSQWALAKKNLADIVKFGQYGL